VYHPHKTFCAVEVGSSAGDSSRLALRRILDEYGRQENSAAGGGRGDSSFAIYSYESAPSVYRRAVQAWPRSSNLHIYNELFITRQSVDRILLPLVQRSKKNGEHDLEHIDYADMEARIKKGEVAGYLKRTPPCRADLVAIASTRHLGVGIVATILSHE
jgi:hypothetical protein